MTQGKIITGIINHKNKGINYKDFKGYINYLKDNYDGKTVGIVAHRAPQLALEVITKGITWEEANKNDWRKTGDWQPGWEYIIK